MIVDGGVALNVVDLDAIRRLVVRAADQRPEVSKPIYLLIVEKHSIFTRLVNIKFCFNTPGDTIIYTGCGYPSLASRAYARRFCDTQRLWAPHLPQLPGGPLECRAGGGLVGLDPELRLARGPRRRHEHARGRV